MNGRQFLPRYRINKTDDYFQRWNAEATLILEKVAKLNPTIGPSKRDVNENGSIVNKLICSLENEVLFYTFNYLQQQGYNPEVLCFDGLMVRQQGELQSLSTVLCNLSDHVNQQMQYNVKFAVKPMNEGLDLNQICFLTPIQLNPNIELLTSGLVSKSVQELLLATQSEVGYAQLYCNIYGTEHIKMAKNRMTNGFMWNDETKLWVHFDEAVTESISDVLNEYFEDQITILEHAKSSDLLKNNTEAQECIKRNIADLTTSLTKIMNYKSLVNIWRLAKRRLIDTTFQAKINNYEYLLPIDGGKKINLKTLEITPRTIDDYFDHELKVNFTTDPAELTLIDNFMMEIMDIHEDNVDEFPNHNQRAEFEAFQVNLGYCISGCNKKKVFFIWHGPSGNNAKSTLANFVEQVFGKYAKPISRSVIEEQDRPQGSTPNSALMAVKGVHIGFINETAEKMKLSSHDIKILSSGGQDTITTRELMGTQETFASKMKPVVLCNRRPTLNATDKALVDRIRYIPFLNKFEPSRANIEKVENLKTYHKDAFFSWCVLGAKKYFDTETLPHTLLQQETTTTFANDNDTLVTFIKEHCVTEEKTLNKLTGKYKVAVYPVATFKTDYVAVFHKACIETMKTDMKMKGFKCSKDPSGKMSFYGIRPKTFDDVIAEQKKESDATAAAEEFDEVMMMTTTDSPMMTQHTTETASTKRKQEEKTDTFTTWCSGGSDPCDSGFGVNDLKRLKSTATVAQSTSINPPPILRTTADRPPQISSIMQDNNSVPVGVDSLLGPDYILRFTLWVKLYRAIEQEFHKPSSEWRISKFIWQALEHRGWTGGLESSVDPTMSAPPQSRILSLEDRMRRYAKDRNGKSFYGLLCNRFGEKELKRQELKAGTMGIITDITILSLIAEIDEMLLE